MAKKETNVIEPVVETTENLAEVVDKAEEVLKVSGEVVQDLPAIPEDDYILMAEKSDKRVLKNVAKGVGLAAASALAIYGVYSLVKKGVKLIREKNKEKEAKHGNGLDHPEYEYKKVELGGKKDPENKPESEKPRMGFRVDR